MTAATGACGLTSSVLVCFRSQAKQHILENRRMNKLPSLPLIVMHTLIHLLFITSVIFLFSFFLFSFHQPSLHLQSAVSYSVFKLMSILFRKLSQPLPASLHCHARYLTVTYIYRWSLFFVQLLKKKHPTIMSWLCSHVRSQLTSHLIIAWILLHRLEKKSRWQVLEKHGKALHDLWSGKNILS